MCENRRLAGFTREITTNGVLADVLDRTPPAVVVATLAAIARESGYAVRAADLEIFLAGFDARFA